jgi:hypothetical protein
MTMLLNETEITRRLAEHLCVWCRNRLEDTSPDLVFCGDHCQSNWHQWRLDTGAPKPGDDVVQAIEAMLVPRLEDDGDLLMADRMEADGWHAVAQYRALNWPGKLRPVPQQLSGGGQATVLGDSTRQLASHPALTQTHGPLRTAPYPHIAVARYLAQGWRIIRAGTPLHGGRYCPTCRCYTPPITAAVLTITQTCSRCHTEYPGPVMVHMVSAGAADMISLACVTANGGGVQRTPTPGVDEMAGGAFIASGVWDALYARALQQGAPWCDMPTCTREAMHWLLLSAPLQYQGWQWVPSKQPLHIGLCPIHHTGLTADLLRHPLMPQRLRSVPGTPLTID